MLGRFDLVVMLRAQLSDRAALRRALAVEPAAGCALAALRRVRADLRL